ncbi:hypothetical protein ACO0SA_004033 [Hanseniaspora valbyensis]
MGRNKRANNKQNSGKRSQTGGWKEIEKENLKWETYYKKQPIFKDDEEFETFKKFCKEGLPLTFRFTNGNNITTNNDRQKEILTLFKEKILPNLHNVEYENEIIPAPVTIPWYESDEHDDILWQYNISKTIIRKKDQFKRFQQFLVMENVLGNIARQELVSMIPPLLLKVKPTDRVLDMCAAPGSKTMQLLEFLHSSEEATGFVMANDADFKRSHMLTHQLKKINSPNLLIVNHDAQFFPKLFLDNDFKNFMSFDKILCDVPCSGDGTMRKNVNVWKEWTIQGGNGLHQIQLNILKRGLKLLTCNKYTKDSNELIGNEARLVYSTCSLNPIENEAVVAAALREFNSDPYNVKRGERIRLLDSSNDLKGLKRIDGIHWWKVFNREAEELAEYDENSDKCVKMSKSMWPPTKEEIEEFKLERCIRIYPHLQNTGGFFITAFEKYKVGEENAPKRVKLDETEDKEEEQVAAVTNNTTEPVKKSRMPRDFNEEPFIFLPNDHEVIQAISDYYELSSSFPRDTLLVRNASGQPIKSIYYTSPIVKNVIQTNEQRLKLVFAGVKMFIQQSAMKSTPENNIANVTSRFNWRIQNESLPHAMKFMDMEKNKLIFRTTDKEFVKLCMFHNFCRYEELFKIDPEFKKYIENVNVGGCAFIYFDRQGSETDIKENLMFPVWLGKNCLNFMINKELQQELLYKLFELKIEDIKALQEKESKQAKIKSALVETETPVEATPDSVGPVIDEASEQK